jgi:hypothetical protein
MTDEWDYGVQYRDEALITPPRRLRLPDLARARVWTLALASPARWLNITPVRTLGGPNTRVCLTFSLLLRTQGRF